MKNQGIIEWKEKTVKENHSFKFYSKVDLKNIISNLLKQTSKVFGKQMYDIAVIFAKLNK